MVALVATLVLAFGALTGALAATSARPRHSDSWTRLPNMPHPRGEVTAAVGARVDLRCPPLDDACDANPVRMFVIGGITGLLGSTVSTVDLFEPIAGRWSRGPDLPEHRHHPGASGAGGTVYVSGGARTATNWAPERAMWSLQPNESRWRREPDMPEGRMAHQMVTVGTRLFVIGGRGRTSNVLIFDIRAKTWSTGAQMPRPRDHLAAVAVGTSIYAIGGRDTDLTRRVDVYDSLSDSWSAGPALPIPMSAMAAGLLDDGLHVVGGEDPRTFGGHVIDRSYVLPPGATAWRSAPLPILPTHGAASVVVGGRLVIAGGARRQGALSPLGWTGLTEALPAR